jgi:hypothetical protein
MEKMSETEIEWYVGQNLFTEKTYPGCTDEQYAKLNTALLAGVIAADPDAENIYETIQKVSETLYF